MSSSGSSGRGIGSVPTDPFSNFVSNAPLADTPGSSDMLALIQNGLTKKLPIGDIPGLTPIVTVPVNILPDPTTSYAILLTDYFVGVNNTVGAPVTLSLPSSPGAGRPIQIADVAGTVDGTNAITIDNGTIDDQTGYILPFAWDCLTLLSLGIGNRWKIISKLVG
jgi:hypothetical protein